MIVFFPRDLFIFPDQFGRSTDVLIDLFFLTMITLPARDLQSSTRIYYFGPFIVFEFTGAVQYICISVFSRCDLSDRSEIDV